jgi:RNA polymerase sigma factor (sigma-70 family)
MAMNQMSEFIQHLRRTMLAQDQADLTDGQLLEGYISRRDEAALASLVRRHGPMVWGVCLRVLSNYHDAEDAFQATFLVLVRKAASIASRELLANWLYGVAHQTALKARAAATKRCAREKQGTEMPEPAVAEQDLWRDVQPLLDEELSRLPDKYRAVIVLSDLEGKTRKEAARQLGVPEGTIASRLATARTMLAKRLTQRGVALSGGALAAVLTEKVASAGVPTSVVSSAIKAASLFAAGQAAATGAISVNVAALTEGVMKTMLLTRLKVVMVLFVVAGLTGAAGVIYRTQAAGQPNALRATERDDKRTQIAPKKPVAVAAAAENILQNAGFEEGDRSPAHWSQGAQIDGVRYIWDKENGKQGKASLCLHKTAKRYFPIAQWYQVVDRKGNKPALRVSAQVKAQGVTKAILDVIFLDDEGKAIGHQWASYIGAKEAGDPPVSHDWKEYAGRVKIPPAAKKLQVGLQIYGPGKVWFDEVTAEYAE